MPSRCGLLSTEAGDNEDLETQRVGSWRMAGGDHFTDVKTVRGSRLDGSVERAEGSRTQGLV